MPYSFFLTILFLLAVAMSPVLFLALRFYRLTGTSRERGWALVGQVIVVSTTILCITWLGLQSFDIRTKYIASEVVKQLNK